MRIGAFNQISQIYSASKPIKTSQIQQVYQTQKPQKTTSTAKTTKSFADNLQISSIGKDIQTLKQAVANSPDIREDVTAPIKAKVNAGTYEVSGDDFASKLLEKYGM